MLGDIGLIVAAYAFTRMLAFCTNPSTNWWVKFFAVLTMIIATIGGFDILLKSMTGSQPFNP